MMIDSRRAFLRAVAVAIGSAPAVQISGFRDAQRVSPDSVSRGCNSPSGATWGQCFCQRRKHRRARFPLPLCAGRNVFCRSMGLFRFYDQLECTGRNRPHHRERVRIGCQPITSTSEECSLLEWSRVQPYVSARHS